MYYVTLSVHFTSRLPSTKIDRFFKQQEQNGKFESKGPWRGVNATFTV